MQDAVYWYIFLYASGEMPSEVLIQQVNFDRSKHAIWYVHYCHTIVL